MPRRSPYVLEFSSSERDALERVARRYTAPYREVIRAKVVLMAAQGVQNKDIAASLDLPVQIVSKWRKRFFQERLSGLEERPRSDRRPGFPPEVVVAVNAIACELPTRRGLPLSRLHIPDIQAEVVSRGLVAEISGTTIWRWLDEDAIKPWTHRSWIFPRDPASAAANAHHPMLVEHEYERDGALAYLAAWDVHGAKLFGRLEPSTGIEPFKRLAAQVMELEPHRSARRVFGIVDNGSSHQGEASIERLQAAHPNLSLVRGDVEHLRRRDDAARGALRHSVLAALGSGPAPRKGTSGWPPGWPRLIVPVSRPPWELSSSSPRERRWQGWTLSIASARGPAHAGFGQF